MLSIESRIAKDIAASERQVDSAIKLLDEGATVPFIARYRKEITGGLDDTQLRLLEERLSYLRELEERRATILASIEEQGKMTPELLGDIMASETKARLEDLYLPYKPKRRTKAQIAREAGLEPLAMGLLNDPMQTPETFAASFVDAEKGISDIKAALDGARHILLEHFSENAALVGEMREWLTANGQIRSQVIAGKEKEGAKYSDYFTMLEPIRSIPSHRTLALFRARAEGILELELEPGTEPEEGHILARGKVAVAAGIADKGRPADAWLLETARQAWLVKLHVHLTLDLYGQVRERAEAEAIRVFGDNLKDLLLAAPAGPKVVLGLDPGMRTGCKLAIVDHTGKVLFTGVIYPHQPQNQWDASVAALAALCLQYGVALVSIGNGTGSRESDLLIIDLMRKHPELKLRKMVVSEAGASVYSASELAAKEFPDMDVTLRGAVSIARRLQDPLAELVKIDPKSIGVGQYQHDVNQIKLGQRLDGTVEDCVNSVGVDLNTASGPLLARVAGLSNSLADNIVKFREANGAFLERSQLKNVPRLGIKAFEQCAGFLRISGGANPLDASGVHPESYPVVQRILNTTGRELKGLIGDVAFLRTLSPDKYTDDYFGAPTVRDILKELEKPGRDPRPEFKTATFASGVTQVKHLAPGMILEGVVSNVAAFGAFVDLGVHQDGLIHISQLSGAKFVKDPREVVKTGQIIKVKVLEVDLERKRISLTMRLDAEPEAPAAERTPAQRPENRQERAPRAPRPERAPRAANPAGQNPAPNPAPRTEQPRNADRPAGDQRPAANRPASDQRPAANRPAGDQRPTQRPDARPERSGSRPQGSERGDRGGDRNFDRNARPAAPAQKSGPPAPKLGSAFADLFANFGKK